MDNFTISACVNGYCNLKCKYCIAGMNRFQDTNAEIDFDKLLLWLNANFPGCRVHFTGGEPLLIPNFGTQVKKFIDAGYTVAIFTNGTLLSENQDLFGLGIQWQVSHHIESGVSVDDFFEQVDLIKNENPLITRVYWGRNALNDRQNQEHIYASRGYRFKWLNFKGGYRDLDMRDFVVAESPNEQILMVDPHGNICNCSSDNHGTIGHIEDESFDYQSTLNFKCPNGGYPYTCQACQSPFVLAKEYEETE